MSEDFTEPALPGKYVFEFKVPATIYIGVLADTKEQAIRRIKQHMFSNDAFVGHIGGLSALAKITGDPNKSNGRRDGRGSY